MDSPRTEELRRRVQADPASLAFAALAEAYRRAGRHEEAIALCRSGLERHPTYISAHVTLGRALLEVGRYDEARGELEHVLQVAPENLAAIRGLAEIHDRQGQTAEADDLSASTVAEMAAALAIGQPPEAITPPGPVAVPPNFAAPPAHELPLPLPVTIVSRAATSGPEPALRHLEAFLQAIVHARHSADGLHLS